jgi:glycosyltransferase involved in cell wall biosynthesis
MQPGSTASRDNSHAASDAPALGIVPRNGEGAAISGMTIAGTTEVPYSPAWYESLRGILGDAACRQLGFYALPPGMRLSVVIPVYNEEETLRELVDRVCAVPLRKEVILIDDCSKDRSREILEEYAARGTADDMNHFVALYHAKNRGKGAALRTGFEKAGGDIVLVQDADLEYDPSEYPRLIQPIVEGRADVVFGSRFLGDQPHRVLYFWHYLANKMLTALSNCFTNLNLTDMETCYKVFRREVIAEIAPKLKQNRFGFEPEITARVARRRHRIYEMSVSYSGRTYEQGKKIGWKDGVQALWCIVRYGLAD